MAAAEVVAPRRLAVLTADEEEEEAEANGAASGGRSDDDEAPLLDCWNARAAADDAADDAAPSRGSRLCAMGQVLLLVAIDAITAGAHAAVREAAAAAAARWRTEEEDDEGPRGILWAAPADILPQKPSLSLLGQVMRYHRWVVCQIVMIVLKVTFDLRALFGLRDGEEAARARRAASASASASASREERTRAQHIQSPQCIFAPPTPTFSSSSIIHAHLINASFSERETTKVSRTRPPPRSKEQKHVVTAPAPQAPRARR
jgi:hypothetical protein